MKKIFAFLLAFTMPLSLAACGGSASTPSSSAPASAAAVSSSAVSAPVESTSEAPSEAFSEPTAAPAPSAEMSSEPASAPESLSEEAPAQPEETGAKALVIYFSWSGNTKTIAGEIASQTGADTFELVPVIPYSTDYNTVLDEAQNEQSENARPEITGGIENFASYDVVYLGFPNWWGDMPMILYSFLDAYDLSGKTIAPFVSSGGSGFSGTLRTIAGLEPGATITDGLSLSSSASQNPGGAVTEWLTKIGLAQ